MNGALAELAVWGTRNRLRRQLRRLRTPRYAIAMLVGLGYLWAVFARHGAPAPFAARTGGETGLLLTAGGLAVIVASWWLRSADNGALVFSPAEVQFLFPAPLTRRTLVRFKLAQAQLVILVTTMIWVAILGGAGGSVWMRGFALWILFSTLYLHRVAVGLVRAGTAEHGLAGARRHAVALTLVALAVGAALWSIATALPAIHAVFAGDAGGGGQDPAGALRAVLDAPAMHVVLLPFRLVAAPVFITGGRAWFEAAGIALAIMLAHYPWVLRSDAPFEESAAVAADRRAAARAARASGAVGRGAARLGGSRAGSQRATTRRAWIPLTPTGSPATAIIWKNGAAFVRTTRPALTLFLIFFLGIGFAAVSASTAEGASGIELLGLVALLFAGACTLLGPLWFRVDLRQDMLRIASLRALPLTGRAVVGAEIAGSAIIVSAIQGALLLTAYALLWPAAPGSLTHTDRTAILLAALVLLPVVNAAGIAIQNAAALLFPGWVRLGPGRMTGVEAVGQGILTSFGSALLLAALLLVPAAVGAAVAVGIFPHAGLWALLPAAVVAAGGLAGELALVLLWLGRVFERTDPGAVSASG